MCYKMGGGGGKIASLMPMKQEPSRWVATGNVGWMKVYGYMSQLLFTFSAAKLRKISDRQGFPTKKCLDKTKIKHETLVRRSQ